MPVYDWTLYDTAVFGATAVTDHELFKVAQNGDATHTQSFTNSRGAGVMPANEQFDIDTIGISPDGDFSANDRGDMWDGAFITIRVNNQDVFTAPLRMCAGYAAYSGHFTQAAAADMNRIGLEGMGYKLNKPITIKGGMSFSVIVSQRTAITAASNVKTMLRGNLTLP